MILKYFIYSNICISCYIKSVIIYFFTNSIYYITVICLWSKRDITFTEISQQDSDCTKEMDKIDEKLQSLAPLKVDKTVITSSLPLCLSTSTLTWRFFFNSSPSTLTLSLLSASQSLTSDSAPFYFFRSTLTPPT